MRTIAARAGVSQSLIHYHFATKEQLFAEVFSRFMDPMNSRRIALIESFLKKGPRKKSQAIEELVQILIAPWIEINDKRDQTGSGEFAPIRDQKCIS